ncbi:MAG: GNAT family N-acetyltransferase [Actinomycetota bacterium]
MRRQIVDVTLENLSLAPPEALDAVFWELREEAHVDPRFQKEGWFSSTLLEWGACGKLLSEGDRAIGFAQYAPGSLFPRLESYRCGSVSADAVYLAYCYVVKDRRGRGVGTDLVRTVARDLVDRGFRALESLGDRDWENGWVLPAPFLGSNRFTVLRDDRRFPLMRRDLSAAPDPERATARETASVGETT